MCNHLMGRAPPEPAKRQALSVELQRRALYQKNGYRYGTEDPDADE